MQNQIVPENDSVFIGVCGERFDLPDFEASKDAILARCGSHITQLHTARGHRVDRNRDKIVQAFYAHPGKPDWLLFLDSDMVFPDDIVFRLLSHRKPIVGGLYFHRQTHVPFVFRDGGWKIDEWKRKIRSHVYCRDEVYDFIKRANVEPREQAVAVDGTPGRLFQCDAVATGAMLIHRSVLDAIEVPWFEYVGGAESEDLSFCRRAREKGFEVYADLGTICGHLTFAAKGYAQFMRMYNTRGLHATNYGVEDAVSMLAELANDRKAEENLKGYTPNQLADHWEHMKSEPGVRDIDFYRSAKTGTLYIRELLHWNASPTFGKFRESLVGYEGRKVLEIGSGIGSIAIQLAAQGCDVDAYEANAKVRAFARKRFRMLIDNGKILGEHGEIRWKASFRRGSKLPATPSSYDLVVALDILEHMDQEQLEGVVEYLAMYLKPGGRMFIHNAWGNETGLHPFHYDHSEIWPDILAHNGLFQLSPMWLVKEDL